MRRHGLNRPIAVLIAIAAGAACSTTPSQPTFSRDIAPILYANCASCHRPIDERAPRPAGTLGSAEDPICVAGAPFSVLDPEAVRRNARAIASAVQRRAMPPWLPEPGHGEFTGDRRLSDDQIALITTWVERGAPEGDPADAPERPTFSGGWQLGTPDLVLTLTEPYVLPPFDSAQGRPAGRDVFRNFVIPVPITETRYVRAVEFRADRPQVLHHADLAVDLGRVSRAHERADPGPGFDTMDGGDQVMNVYGWSPGKVPVMEAAENAWTLNPGTDFVLLLHMIAGAQRETVQPSIGLFFSDTPPTRTPISVKLESKAMAIPPGEANYVVEDSYVLPVDVDAVSIYPHAHYLGKDMRGTATLPDGSVEDLLWIRQWDFRWQDRYRYKAPLPLPKGTKVAMRFTFDNSKGTGRVRSGPRSTDEMAQLWIEVVPRRPEDAAVLNADFARRSMQAAIAGAEMDVRLEPRLAGARNVLATRYLTAGRVADAQRELEEALRLDPRHAEAHSNLGVVLQAQGRLAEGMTHLRRAVSLKPKDDAVHFNLGGGLLASGQPDAAIREFRTAIALNPENADAHFNLALILGPRNQLDEAVLLLQRAVEINPLNADAHHNLSVAYLLQRRVDAALAAAETAVRLKPDSAPAQEQLRRLRAARPR